MLAEMLGIIFCRESQKRGINIFVETSVSFSSCARLDREHFVCQWKEKRESKCFDFAIAGQPAASGLSVRLPLVDAGRVAISPCLSASSVDINVSIMLQPAGMSVCGARWVSRDGCEIVLSGSELIVLSGGALQVRG